RTRRPRGRGPPARRAPGRGSRRGGAGAGSGRGVSGYAFDRHRGTVARLLDDVEHGRLPAGCASAVLLDRPAAARLTALDFGARPDPAARA
ncbi:hypothetical protein ACM614_04470, partial [Streptomyces sp. 12297]